MELPQYCFLWYVITHWPTTALLILSESPKPEFPPSQNTSFSEMLIPVRVRGHERAGWNPERALAPRRRRHRLSPHLQSLCKKGHENKSDSDSAVAEIIVSPPTAVTSVILDWRHWSGLISLSSIWQNNTSPDVQPPAGCVWLFFFFKHFLFYSV